MKNKKRELFHMNPCIGMCVFAFHFNELLQIVGDNSIGDINYERCAQLNSQIETKHIDYCRIGLDRYLNRYNNQDQPQNFNQYSKREKDTSQHFYLNKGILKTQSK